MSRLLSLEIEGFRQFSIHQSIPLDADVVLVFGPNGSGKTTLLSAIEFALTGGVADLARYAPDYPDCLIHQPAGETARAILRMSTDDGELAYSGEVSRGGGASVHVAGGEPWKNVADIYMQRAFLSQTRLRRLLEDADKGDTTGAPLPKILEQMLGLQVLDTLTTGLQPVMNIQTLRSHVANLGDAYAVKKAEGVRLEQLVDQAAALEARARALKEAHGNADGPTGLDEARNLLELETQELGESNASLERVRGLKEEYARLLPHAERRAAAAEAAADAEGRVNVAAAKVAAALSEAEPRLVAMGLAAEAWGALTGWSRADAMRESTAASLFRRRDELERIEGLDRALAESASELARIEERWETLKSSPGMESIRELEATTGVLRAVLPVITSDDCPVCGRDYSDVHAGSLRDRVELELRGLESRAKELHEKTQERAALQMALASTRARVEDLRSEVATGHVRRGQLPIEIGQLGAILDALETTCHEALLLRQAAAGLESLRQDVALANEAAERTLEIARTVCQSDVTNVVDPLASTIAALDAAEENAASEVEARSVRVMQLQEGLQSAAALESVEREIGVVKMQLADTSARVGQADSEIVAGKAMQSLANGLLDHVERTKREVLHTAIAQGLNHVWADVFQRLVRGERFEPRVSDPRLYRRRLQLDIQAVIEGSDCVMKPGAVLSSGNLNTYALSLFLALNILDRSGLPICVLDDPVQSMDEVHVVNFASLVRTICRDVGRQVVVAVHERALFDYLTLELLPSTPDETLLAVEITPREDSDSKIQYTAYDYSASPGLETAS